MKVVIKGPLRDTLAFILHLKKRNRIFRRAGMRKLAPGALNVLAEGLHPQRQLLQISEVREETPSSRTYCLKPANPSGRVAFFRAGQYIAIGETIGGVAVWRPFSISSSPDEALVENFYDITIKSRRDGFYAPWAAENWKPGRVLSCSAPAGNFFHEPLRDERTIVCIAGGSGITPFRSILKDCLKNTEDVRFFLIYGVTDPEEIIYREELEQLGRNYSERFRMTVVYSERAAGPEDETGFITADLIRRHVPEAEKHTFFICGPPDMYEFLISELDELHLSERRLRTESYGSRSEEDKRQVVFTLSVLTRGETVKIPAAGSETVLTALERAGLNPPSLCRTGECGWCRSRLIDGEIYMPEKRMGLRAADAKFGWFHPCSSYPRSDMTIEVPRNPIA